MADTWTILADIFTLGTAFYTYSMARTMRKTYIDDQQPLLGFEGLQIEAVTSPENQTTGIVTVAVMLKNYGKSVVKYKMETLTVTVNGRTLDEPQYDNKGGYVYPQMVRLFSFPPLSDIDLSNGTHGIIEYKLTYRAKHDKQPKQLAQKLKYFSLAPGHIRYNFLSEDEGW